MASRTIIQYIDDIDGDEAAETVTFALDGVSYEIDLNEKNSSSLRETLAPWVTNARRQPQSRSGTSRDVRHHATATATRRQEEFTREERNAMRAWGPRNGYNMSPNGRGRIPRALAEAWVDAGKPRV